jgi:hypothetical protein
VQSHHHSSSSDTDHTDSGERHSRSTRYIRQSSFRDKLSRDRSRSTSFERPQLRHVSNERSRSSQMRNDYHHVRSGSDGDSESEDTKKHSNSKPITRRKHESLSADSKRSILVSSSADDPKRRRKDE